jgi:hypothetical protein
LYEEAIASSRDIIRNGNQSGALVRQDLRHFFLRFYRVHSANVKKNLDKKVREIATDFQHSQRGLLKTRWQEELNAANVDDKRRSETTVLRESNTSLRS